MPREFLYLLIIISAFLGSVISFYIRVSKSRGETLFCPTGSDCNLVLNSRYSRLVAGIPNEDIGLVYYVSIGLLYTFFWIYQVIVVGLDFMALVVTVIALLISIYLTYLQAVKLKEWCSWCVLSAILCVVIFVSSLYLFIF